MSYDITINSILITISNDIDISIYKGCKKSNLLFIENSIIKKKICGFQFTNILAYLK